MKSYERMLLNNCEECYARKTYYEGRDSSIKTYKFVGINSVEIVDSDGFVYIFNGFEDRFYRMMDPEDIVTDEDFLLDFSNRFNYFKNETKNTYEYISKDTDISVSTLKKYSTGSRMPSFHAAMKIACCLNCDVKDLTGF